MNKKSTAHSLKGCACFHIVRASALTVMLLASCFLLFAVNLPAAGYELPFNENQVKAAYLVKFIKYIEWPFDDKEGRRDMTIGVIGAEQLWNEMTPYAGRENNKWLIKLRRVKKISDIKGCRMLFIGKDEKARLAQILDFAARNEVLTVSDIKFFAHWGGTIGFVRWGEAVRFDINTDKARAVGALVSVELLKLALSVIETENMYAVHP